MSLDLTKPVQTRDGREVKQLTVFDAKNDEGYSIYGVLNESIECWTADGEYVWGSGSLHAYDLVNVPERVQHTGYLRVWRNREGGWEFSSMMPHAPDLSLEAGPYLGYIRVDIDTDLITSTEGKSE